MGPCTFKCELSIGTCAARMALWPAAYEEPHLQVGYMAAPTSNCRALNKTLANGEPSIHGPIVLKKSVADLFGTSA